MPKDIIHFAHANSFPAKTYNKLFSYLESDFEIGYLERHAHNPKFPVTDGWTRLADEVKAEIEQRYSRPVIGVGHSLGGILHFLAAVERPDLYKAIVLLDAPFVSRFRGAAVRTLKKFGLLDRIIPAHLSRFRRNRWQSADEAFDHFRNKPNFKNFDAEVLRDYVEHGTVKTDTGFELAFKPSIETHIYRTLPESFYKLRKNLNVPGIYIGGTHSREAKAAGLRSMMRTFPFHYYFIEGSHLFPFERPEETALIIHKSLNQLSK